MLRVRPGEDRQAVNLDQADLEDLGREYTQYSDQVFFFHFFSRIDGSSDNAEGVVTDVVIAWVFGQCVTEAENASMCTRGLEWS